MAHTPGPWHVEKGVEFEDVFGVLWGAHAICNEKRQEIGRIRGVWGLEQALVNACLIAAAPELLAACEAAYRAILNHHAAGERIAGSKCEYCKGELAQLEAAIAQATGGTP